MSASAPQPRPWSSGSRCPWTSPVSASVPRWADFCTTLSRNLLNEDGTPRLESTVRPGMPLQVICYERADGLGFGVSGAVTRARGIRASFPDVDLTQIPMAVPVGEEKLVYLLDPVGASRRSFAVANCGPR